jgi:hypothetical protein
MDSPHPPQASPPTNYRMNDSTDALGYRPTRGMDTGYGR